MADSKTSALPKNVEAMISLSASTSRTSQLRHQDRPQDHLEVPTEAIATLLASSYSNPQPACHSGLATSHVQAPQFLPEPSSDKSGFECRP